MEKRSLSERGHRLAGEVFAEGQQDHFRALADLYDPASNTHGYINMGASETTLVNREIIDLIDTVQRRTELRAEDIHYVPNHGSKKFRDEIASYWQPLVFNQNAEKHLTGENIVLSTGGTVVLDMLARMICDPGDVFLVPTPCYAMFAFDVGQCAKAAIAPVDAGADLDVSAFERVLTEEKERGKNVRAVLLSSPNNPVGTVYTHAQLSGVVDFCIKHDLDIVSDELYCQTVFDESSEWISMLDVVPEHYLERVHVVAGFAKDFALPGFKVGFAISFNQELLSGLRNLAYFAPVSNYAQFILRGILRGPELAGFLRLNRQTLRAAYAQVTDGLRALNVTARPAQAGMFVMADFSRYLKDPTFESELQLLGKLHDELKVNLAPGCAYNEKTPGWLRICYPQGKDTVEELFRRLGSLRPN